MTWPEIIVVLYAASGVIAYTGMGIYFRKERRRGSGENTATPMGAWGMIARIASFSLIPDLLIMPITLIVVVLWPLVFLGFLIYWLDDKDAGDRPV